MTIADTILVERANRVATVTLNRPEALNALDFAMMDPLVSSMASLAADESLRVIVLRGAGAHFMAGGDVRAFAQYVDEAPPTREAHFERLIRRLHAAIELMHRMPHPVIARVQGAVAGFGLSLMCACDLVVAAEDAYFTSAYRQLALTPDGGLTFALPRIIGLRKAIRDPAVVGTVRRSGSVTSRARQQGRAARRTRFNGGRVGESCGKWAGSGVTQCPSGLRVNRSIARCPSNCRRKPRASRNAQRRRSSSKACAFLAKRKPRF